MTAPGRLAVLLAMFLLALLIQGSLAQDSPDLAETLFVQGQQAEARGEYEEACGIYQQVAERYPESDPAPSALFQCAFVLDERLHQVDRALAIYRTVLQLYPNSRVSKKAEIRGGVLAPYAGKWAEVYSDFQGLLTEKKDLREEEFERQMVALIEANPDYPGADQLLFFVAKRAFKEERHDDARALFVSLIERYPGTLSATFAYKGLGDLEFSAGRYAQSAAYYDTATAYAEKLEMPPPSPRQRRKAHLYVGRYQALLVSFLLLIAAAGAFSYLWPAELKLRGTLRSWLGSALSLLPLFGVLYGVALYLLYRDDPSRTFNLSGQEATYVAAAYGLVCVSLLVAGVFWPGAEAKPHGKAVFWTAFPILLVAGNYCIFYALDLTMYLESAFLGLSPLTGLPTP